MKKSVCVLAIFLLMALCASRASATVINLFDWAFNVNGTTYTTGDTLPDYFYDSGFDWNRGLGSLIIDYSPGFIDDYFFVAFFDHDIDDTDDEYGNTYYNEYGVVNGTPSAGQSWEIDEPGFREENPGNIYSHFLDGDLDNTNGVPSTSPDDVSMAMAWNFTTFTDDDLVRISLHIAGFAPSSGFYLSHVDPASQAAIYLSSSLQVNPVPEPATLLISAMGLAGLLGFRYRRGKR